MNGYQTSASNRATMRAQIEELFADFYYENLIRFSQQIPSLLVDGQLQQYSACLPERTTQRILERL